MSYLHTFTNLIEEFITKLNKLYPEDKDFANIKMYLFILKKTNPRKIVNEFNNHVLIYREQIVKKDEDFLLNNDFIEDILNNQNNGEESDININQTNDTLSQEISTLMFKIRTYWCNMDTETKNNIWQYLNIFVLLSDKLKD